MVIYVNTFEELVLDGVMFGKFKNWLLVISQSTEKVHVFTTTDERSLKEMMKNLIQKDKAKSKG